MNKKNVSVAGVIAILLCAFAFNLPIQDGKNNQKFILSTTGIIDSLVEEIAFGGMDRQLLIGKHMDPHSYQIRKGDSKKIEDAAIIFANGLSLEHNPSLYHKLQKSKAVFLGDEIFSKEKDLIIKKNNEIDPHIWMDLHIMKIACLSICNHLIEVDKDNEVLYQSNTEKLLKKMTALDEKIQILFLEIPKENRYLVTSHDAFNYFVKRYFGDACDRRLFAMQGLSPESEISLLRMKNVVEFIKEHQIKMLFFESNLPKDAMVKLLEICKRMDIDIEISNEPLYGDTLGNKTYLEMIEHNAEVICKKLQQGEKFE